MSDYLDVDNYRIRGHYSGGWVTGLIAAGLTANGKHFQWRWAPAAPNDTSLCIIRRLYVYAQANTGFSANTNLEFALWRGTAWTVTSTFGTTVSIGVDCKMRSDFPSSLITGGNIKINTTLQAGLIGDGASLGANAVRRLVTPAPASGTVPVFTPNAVLFDDDKHPLVLANNEGFQITSPLITNGGTWELSVNVDWVETEPLSAAIP